MFRPLPKIYAITDRRISGLTHAEQVIRLVDSGITLIQLREKELGAGEWFDDACRAVEYAHQFNASVIVNDRLDVAMAARADGVHLGQTDLPATEARRIAGEKMIIGVSTHTIEQAKAAVLQPVDYLAFGPIFATGTKQEADPVVGIDLLPRIKRMAGRLSLVAIGGITAENISSVLDSGADCVAVVSSLLKGGAISKNTEQFINLFKHY
ncbi:MAG: thiamine phosphate synthase [Acidobacteria bacterium]|nr:thiamine phosphate synthase [Acidobacteriota bacterium]